MKELKVYGVDFTSAPGRRKPLVAVGCVLADGVLRAESSEEMTSLEELAEFLCRPGPWACGLDFPFGQPRGLVEALGWPEAWEGYVAEVSRMEAREFEEKLRADMATRPAGSKHRYRRTDRLSGSASAMMLFRVPVGKMFHRGAPLLLRSGASVVPCQDNGSSRLLFESYPALVARRVIGRRPYKSDDRARQSPEREQARRDLVAGLLPDKSDESGDSDKIADAYGFCIRLDSTLEERFIRESAADGLDSLLCAIQAAWAYGRADRGVPEDCDADEGWIPDPALI
ncbi:DUF429 domain-containing protein [Rubrobacter aplysinae]|uniref:DUF429 domain-containing protein n=1 Tax=Rubrobacter aplysinae TaxID=909625 RepID=UPI00069EB95F|nr:DUF429 domain-containing protein [Rubrobacter aplysinae]